MVGSFTPSLGIISVVDLMPKAAFADARLSYEAIGVLSSLVYIDNAVGDIDISSEELSQIANRKNYEIEAVFSKLEKCGYIRRENGRVVEVLYSPKAVA